MSYRRPCVCMASPSMRLVCFKLIPPKTNITVVIHLNTTLHASVNCTTQTVKHKSAGGLLLLVFHSCRLWWLPSEIELGDRCSSQRMKVKQGDNWGIGTVFVHIYPLKDHWWLEFRQPTSHVTPPRSYGKPTGSALVCRRKERKGNAG